MFDPQKENKYRRHIDMLFLENKCLSRGRGGGGVARSMEAVAPPKTPKRVRKVERKL